MKFKLYRLSITLLIILNLSACSYVQGYFPDKQKDYQFTTEIPPLTIPEDLTKQSTKKTLATNSGQPDSQQNAGVETVPVSAPDSADKGEDIYIDLVEFSGGATRIRIEDNINSVWRLVGKALSRQSIEITDRNEADKVYFVQYDPDFKKVEDGSLWDEALFLFGTDPSQEQEFRVVLIENDTLTEILVLDENDKPLSEGAGFKLLNTLYKTIKADLANSG